MKKVKLDPDTLTVVTFDAVKPDLLNQARNDTYVTTGPWFCAAACASDAGCCC